MSLKRVVIVCLAAVALAPAALAAPRPGKKESPQAEAEHARLQKEIEFNRSLLQRLIQQERDHLDAMLRVMQEMDKGGSFNPAAIASPSPTPETTRSPDAVEPETTINEPPPTRREPVAAVRPRPPPRPANPAPAAVPGGGGQLSGRISVEGDASPTDVVVYVTDVRGPKAKDQTLTIRQENKQFKPRMAVVPRGTKVEFPNQDSVFHNVFSLSPGNTFDLGTYRAGDKPGSIVMTNAGVVKVFCNLHSQMSASILVVPGSLYTKVAADGSYKLPGVPPGRHKIAAWSPNSEPVVKEVDVAAGDNELSFSLSNKQGAAAHSNKFGQPYGSYSE